MIFGSNLLDFAIGLVVIYFLLSLFCSWINEKIAAWTNLRAKTLEDGIEGLLPGTAQELLNHPLICGLKDQHGKNGANENKGRSDRRTSYIDPHTFSTALIQQVVQDGTNNAIAALDEVISKLPEASHSQLSPDIDYLKQAIGQAGTVSTAATGAVERLRHKVSSILADPDRRTMLTAIEGLPVPGPAPTGGGPSAPLFDLQLLRKAAARLQNGQERGALLALIDAAQGDLDRAQQNIEHWFNDAMERLSGWYKRRTQWIILTIGLVAVVLLNADTFAIANDLWHNDAHRQVAVAAAQKQVQNGSASGSQNGADIFNQIQALQVPLGYTTIDRTTGASVPWFDEKWWNGNLGHDVGDYIVRALGWLATAVAISLGAPFWFDLLNKLVNLRNTGDPPKSSTGAASTPATGNPQSSQS